jgi:probable phosphoglycerate mutase
MQGRFVPFIEGLLAEHSGSQQGAVLVGHGGIYRCMLPLVLANVDAAFALAQPIGHTDTIIAKARGKELICTAWN